MSQEFEWPPSDEVIQAHILELEVGPSAQPALPQRDPKVAAKQPDNATTATHFESDGTRKPRHQPAEPPPAEFTREDWPLHSRAATTEFRDLTIERVALVPRAATGSPRVGHPVALRRTHFASYAATIAVSAVCASVATSYLRRTHLPPSHLPPSHLPPSHLFCRRSPAPGMLRSISSVPPTRTRSWRRRRHASTVRPGRRRCRINDRRLQSRQRTVLERRTIARTALFRL